VKDFRKIFRKFVSVARQRVVNNDFKILVEFLGVFGPEASGRVLEVPHFEAARKLERFAAGGVGATERREVCALLQLHPAWVRYLADRVIESRNVGTAEDGGDT